MSDADPTTKFPSKDAEAVILLYTFILSRYLEAFTRHDGVNRTAKQAQAIRHAIIQPPANQGAVLNYFGLTIEPLQASDVAVLAPIMKRAFDEDSRLHLGKPEGGPPGYDNGDFINKWGINSDSQAFKVSKDGSAIGMFIVWITESGDNFLGNLFVDSTAQNKGIGTLIWNFIEQHFSSTNTWRTETPGFSKRNHHFYVNKCGFSIVKIENCGHTQDESYIMEKRMPRYAHSSTVQ